MTSFTATIDTKATTIAEVAAELAATIATAFEGDGDGAVLVGPATAILDDGQTMGVTLMLARPPSRCSLCSLFRTSRSTSPPLLRVRDAIITALGRHGRVRAFSSVRELIAAARAPQGEAPPLLH